MPQLVTDRLILRPYRSGEHHLMHRLLADPRVTFWRQHPVDRAETRAVFERQAALGGGLGWWTMFLADAVEPDGTPVFVGNILLQPLGVTGEIEIGWHVMPDHWANGYATEAARALLAHAFETLDLSRIVAVVLPENARSLGVIHKLGMADRGERVHAGRVHRYFAIERHGDGAATARADAALE